MFLPDRDGETEDEQDEPDDVDYNDPRINLDANDDDVSRVNMFCINCNGMTDMLKGTNTTMTSEGQWSTHTYECTECGGNGSSTDNYKSGVVDLSDEEIDARLLDLHEKGVHPQVAERGA